MFAKAYKHSRFTHVGLRLWKTPDDDHQILIVHIDDHTIFTRSGLKVGMKIDRINNFVCGRNNSNLDEIYAVMNDAIGELTIYTSAPRISLLLDARPSTTPDEISSTWSAGKIPSAKCTLSPRRSSILNSMHLQSSQSHSEYSDFRESMWTVPHFYGFVDGLVL
jgi:hypothetical protein